ncbi:MAG: YhcH/YjgK/YiaL family protein [Alphaproteobacteria bacterium]|jgi:YhcH/YjgK/YiaL family protein|nr:YhcH/YjgK/YiaL family protein [Alphaproteobacteria bacterium]
MIIDYLKNKKLYNDAKIQKILDFIEITDFSKIEEGKTVIDDDNFFMLSNLTTKNMEEGFWESHKKYIDIHYVLEGEELFGYENISELKINKDYNEEKDLITYHGDMRNPIVLKPNMFIVAYPEDAHMPNILVGDKKAPLKKIIFKIKY